MKKVIEYVPLSKIQADPEQPRRNFDALKLSILAESIKHEGVLDPLKVEAIGGGYLLVDGERRYRACTIGGIKEVPVIVMDKMSIGEKLVKQFHLQETHEGWSAAERAKALADVAKEIGTKTNSELAAALGLSERTVRTYVQFGKIINKDKFIKSEIPVDFIEAIASLNNCAKRTYQESNDKEFTGKQMGEFEGHIIEMVKNGAVKRKNDLTKIKDAIRKSPKIIDQIIQGLDKTVTADELFFKSQAQVEYALRNLAIHASYAGSFARKYLAKPAVPVSKETYEHIVLAIRDLKAVANRYDKDYK